MKNIYSAPELQFEEVRFADVITTSGLITASDDPAGTDLAWALNV